MSGSITKMSASTSKMPAAKMVMVRTEDVAPLLTCQLCFKIKRNSTSIIECIHSFCKKCIIKKLTEEKLNSCPICNTDLGCTPLCKLRPDHNIQSLVATLFHSIKKNSKEPDVSAREAKETATAQAEDEEPGMRTIPKPARRKKRSLSSIVNTPNVSCEMLPTGRKKLVPKKRSLSSIGNTSNYVILDDDDGDAAAATDDDDYVEEEEDPKPAPATPVSVKQKGKARGRQKRSVTTSEGIRISAQAVVDANANKNNGMNSVWLSLVATYRQDVGPPLPQIPSCYLRLKDIHSPVSAIKKYLVNKLDLESEDEVEIELLGRPVPSNMELYMLVYMWAQAVSERVSTSVGSSARDFIMVLSYSRKA